MREAAFMTFLALGLILLLFGTFRARMHWRADVEAYGRNTPQLELLIHPDRFVSGSAVGIVKRFYLGGGMCLGLAVGLALYEIVFVAMAKW